MAARRPFDFLQEQTVLQLQTLPGIDARLARSLVRAGVTSLDDLGRRDPHDLVAGLDGADGPPQAVALQAVAAAVHACRFPAIARPWWHELDRIHS